MHKSALSTTALVLLALPLLCRSLGAEDKAPASEAAGDQITLERIMADPDWIGNSPENAYWADDSKSVYFERKAVGSEHRELYRESTRWGANESRVADADLGHADQPGGSLSLDFRRKVYVREGDVFVKDLASGDLRQLTRTSEEETSPLFMADGKHVAFRRGDAWIVRDLESDLESQAADLKAEKDPEKKDDPTYLSEQQQRLFDVLQKRIARRDAERARAKAEQGADSTRPPLPYYLGPDVEVADSALSPSGNYLLAVIGKKPDPGKKDSMPDYVTESGYVEVKQIRPRVGAPKPETPKLVLFDLKAHTETELDISVLPGITDDPLKALREAAEAARKARKAKAEAAAGDAAGKKTDKAEAEKAGKNGNSGKGDKSEKAEKPAKPTPRVVAFTDLQWSGDGERVVLQAFSADNKDRWILAVDLAGKAILPLERIHDDAWINWSFRDLGFMHDGRRIWYLSEETGYAHLYVRPADLTGHKRALTTGSFEVSDPVPTRDDLQFYVVANREHPGVKEVYRVSVRDDAMERVTELGGHTGFVLSPDEAQLLLTASFPTRPPELFVVATHPEAPQADQAPRQLTDSTSKEFKSIRWQEPEVVPVPSSHVKAPIYARVYTPEGWSAERKWPAVVFIHGAGYLQNAHKGWSDYFREFMFDNLLLRHGYVVLDMDYRASAGYGRDWRTAIYRQMGWPELEDLADGKAWMVKNKAVDGERIGTWGGSYGGFLTEMSLFRRPDLFACGAALRPVADWASYNHDYTSNILNTPEIDPEAFNKSSPIEYAAGLSKPLLICHGVEDDNVAFQDSVRLVQRLIELKKTRWFETAIFPVEHHGFRDAASWLDEYTRIYDLFEEHLKPAEPAAN